MMIVDTTMLLRRCHAKMDFLKGARDQPTGMEFGSLRTLEMLEKKYPEHKLILTFDNRKNIRREKHPGYKSNRTPLSDEFYERVATFKRFLSCRWLCVEREGYEADDVMHTIASSTQGEHFIYTNDHDLLQCVNDRVNVLKSFKSVLYKWDRQKVEDMYGLPPEHLVHYFAFIGDPVDALPGVSRIPKKYLASIVRWAKTSGFDDERMIKEVLSADWGPKVKAALHEFVEEGLWHYNFELMSLFTVPKMDVTHIEDDTFVVERLKDWNIFTLKMCDKYRSEFEKQLKDEEF